MRHPKKITPETAIKKACVQYLRYRYGVRFYYVNIRMGLGTKPGTPDLLGVLDGQFIAIEFKAPNGKLSDYQKEALAQIQQAGGIALVIRSLEECIEAFKPFKARQGELF